MFFRPLLWPTLMTIPALIILVLLGNWQVRRLHWKNHLIAQIEQRTVAPPRPLDDVLKNAQGPDDINYWHVFVSGVLDHTHELYLFTQDAGGRPVYHVITPLLRGDQPAVFIDRGKIPIENQDPTTRQEGQIKGRVTLTGIVRTPPGQGTFVPDNQPADNIWFFLDTDTMASVAGLKLYLPVIVEVDATPNPGGLPVGGQTVVTLRNNHLGYIITWYGLALALLGVYLIFHIRQGRLGLRGR